MGHLKDKYTKDYFLGGFDETTGRQYGVLGHADFKANRIHERHLAEFEFLTSFAGSLKNKDILEIGFGRGDHIPFFLNEGIHSYHGIDFSPSSVSIAADHVRDPKIRLELREAKDLKESNSYDVIVMYDLIEHVPVFEMEVVWRKIRKILRPAGFVVVSTPIFANPNSSDHSDLTFAEMGLHCHKQTRGTILRTCIQHGFVVGHNNDRCFGLIRDIDLSTLPGECKNRYINNHNALLTAHGLNFSEGRKFSEEEVRSLVPGAGRLLIGCVAENNPKYLAQALRLIQSIRWFGGRTAGANIVVCFIDEAEDEYVAEFRRWGAFIRIVPRFSYFHPQSNKLRLFDLPEVYAYDTIILMDCDTIVVQDPSPFITGDKFQAKIADGPTVKRNVFEKLFAHYGLPFPEQGYKCTVTLDNTICYCNAGVLIFPQKIMRSIVPSWRKYAIDLSMNLDLLNESANFLEQAALTLAFFENPVPFAELPIEMNFPLHRFGPDALERIKTCDPIIIHYHHLTDSSGLIIGGSPSPAGRRIDQFNERLKQNQEQEVNQSSGSRQDRQLSIEVRDHTSDDHPNLHEKLQHELQQRNVTIYQLQNELIRLKIIENSLSWKCARIFHNFFDAFNLSSRKKVKTLFPKCCEGMASNDSALQRAAGKEEICGAPLKVPDKFQKNAPEIRAIGPEVTGLALIKLVIKRLGVNDLSNMEILDVGCGVRFTQAIINCGIPVKRYTGIDVDKSLVDFLRQHVQDPRFSFHAWDVHNAMYNPNGSKMTKQTDLPVQAEFDLIWLFSVFTHLNPSDADALLCILRRRIRKTGYLFFSAFIDNTIESFEDRNPENPLEKAYYSGHFMRRLLNQNSWSVAAVYEKDPENFIQHYFVCKPLEDAGAKKSSRESPPIEQQRVICVLGMHRSGTSSLAGSLEEAGVFLGNVQRENPHNPKGNREHLKIMELHDDLLAANGGSWDHPPEKVFWGDKHRIMRDEIMKEFEGVPLWAFKDPRTVFTLEGWREVLLNMTLVGTFRHPASVAQSLNRRNGMPLEEGLNLWLKYNRRLLEHHRMSNFHLISFDLGEEEYGRAMTAVIGSLGLTVPASGLTFFRSDLRHVEAREEITLPAEVKDVYETLKNISGGYVMSVNSHRPKMSIIVIVFNMRREAARTLFSLSAAYQKEAQLADYEVIVVENGSSGPLSDEFVRSFGPNFRYYYLNTNSQSPVAAANYGVQKSSGYFVGLMIDGARIVTPGVIKYALLAGSLAPMSIISTPGWHLGPDVQWRSIRNGYTREIEDELLDRIHWKENGYRLFEISSFAGSSQEGFFRPIAESNCFFMPRKTFERLGGFDEKFDLPGGGLTNLDIYKRACEMPDTKLMIMLGEGSFHQMHGGISTNATEEENSRLWHLFEKQYFDIRGRPYEPPDKKPEYIGHVPPELLRFVQYSVEKAGPMHLQELETANALRLQRELSQIERPIEENYRDWQAHTKTLELIIKSKDNQIGDLQNSLRDRNRTLNYIYHSYGLGALWVCNKMVDKLFPPNSKRRSLARLILKSIRRPDSRNTDTGGTPLSPLPETQA